MRIFLALLVFLISSTEAFVQVDRKVLIEASAGTWCFVCPRGYVYSQEAHNLYGDDVIFITSHYDDPMGYEEYDMALDPIGYPTGYINRTVFTDFYPENIAAEISPELGQVSPAEVEVIVSFDDETNLLSAEIIVTAAQDFTGDYSIGGVIVENGVTGSIQGYNQVNGYSGGDLEIGNYQFLPEIVSSELMMYNHVARQLLGGFNGVSDIIPDNIINEEVYSVSFDWLVPDEYNSDLIKVIGVIIDNETGEIVNAGKSSYLNGEVNGKPFFNSEAFTLASAGEEYIYHVIAFDPDYDELTLSLSSSNPWLSISNDELGNFVLSGVPLSSGLETIELVLSDGVNDTVQTFELEITEQGFDWVLIGEEDFTSGSAAKQDLAMAHDNTLYSAVTFETQNSVIYRFQDENWNSIDTVFSSVISESLIAINNDNELFYKSGVLLYKLSASDSLEFVFPFATVSGEMEDMIFSSNNELFVVANNNLSGEGELSMLSDGVWTDFNVLTDTEPQFNRFTLNENGNPALIYGEFTENGVSSMVIYYNGSSWENLSDSYIDETASTFGYHDLTIDPNGNIYAALITEEGPHFLNIYKFNGVDWELFEEDLAEGSAEDCEIESNQAGDLLVSYIDESLGGRLVCQRFDGISWTYVGIPGFTPYSKENDLIIDQVGDPIVSYLTYSDLGNVGVKKRQNTISIIEVDTNDPIILFPNPAEDRIRFNSSVSEIKLYDYQGNLLHEIIERTDEVDLSFLGTGFYLCSFSYNGSRSSMTLVVK